VAAATAEESLAAGDGWFARRAEGAPAPEAGRAAPGPIGRAIDAYEEAVAADPGNLEARWKLLRALYYQGEHVAEGTDARREVFDRGRRAAEEALDRLAARVGGREALDELPPRERAARLAGVPEAGRTYFWAAVHWGLWGDAFGRLAAARQGVAGTIRDLAETARALDERYENGGAHRVLGRLHALAPKIPFFTGWIDRDRAVAELRRALALGPDDPLNRLYLAEALLEHRPESRAEALEHLRALLAQPADAGRPVEQGNAKRAAREVLAREKEAR
jgi:tetratricopeptide (TPR) repeat protein